MLKMKYRKTYKTKNFLYLYLLHLFGPPMCSELEFSKSTYLLYSPVCHVVSDQVRKIDCTWCTKLLTCNSAIIITTSVTVMRFDVFGAFLKLEMNTFAC